MYEDLGAEAIYELKVKDFPAIVTYDIYGGNLIVDEVKKYQTKSIDFLKAICYRFFVFL